MESKPDKDCCSGHSCKEVKNIDDPVTISMIASGAILVTGFLIVAFVSGPVGLIVSLGLLALLGLYYAVTGG
jgi:hypothetical protein